MPSLAPPLLPPAFGSRVRRWLLPWLLAVAVLANMAYPMYVHFDFSHSPDTRSYLRMAAGQFDSIRITHRYRVVVPAAAAAVGVPVAKVYGRVWPQRPAGQWPLRFAFYVVNCALLAAAAACWFNAALCIGASPSAAVLALLAVLSSRWAVYAAGLPLTDSLYLLVVALGYYAARRGAGAGWALVLALLAGPLAKESFFLLLPWLCWYGRGALSWPKQAIATVAGVGALALVHYAVDTRIQAPTAETLSNAVDHFGNLMYSARRALSPKGIGELLSIFGFFIFLLPLGLWLDRRSSVPTRWHRFLGWPEATFAMLVGVHMALSGDLGRMGYLVSPVFCAALALVFTHYRRLLRL